MKALVTGGAGFVGTNLIKKLNELGFDVVSIDNYSTGLKENHQPYCNYIEEDIRNVNKYSIYGKVDVVFHLAAIARIQPSFLNPINYFTTNANGTLNLAAWCSENNIPLIYAGSSSKHSGRFKNPYTFSKDIGEDIIELFRTHYNLQATIARFYNVYGPYQITEGGYATLIGRWIDNIEKGIECIVYGDGNQRRDFTHISDIVEGLIKIYEKQAYGYEFELGRGKNYSVNEVASMFEIQPTYTDPVKGGARETLCTSTLAKEILGWVPEKNLEDYITEWKIKRNI